MKYGPSLALARLLGNAAEQSLPKLFETYLSSAWDYVIPMPSTKVQLRRRGFNQSEIIARALSKRSGARVLKVLRNQAAQPQAKQAAATRHRIFRYIDLRPTSKLKNSRVLLVDDVITTGASTTAAALLLRRAGAAQVDVFALARSPAWYRYQEKLGRKVI